MRRHRKHKERDIAEGDENVEAAMEGMRAGPSTISTNPAENEGNLVPGMIGHRFGAIDGDKDTEKRDADAGGEADMEEPPQVEKKKKRHHRLHRHRHSDDTNAQAPKPLSSTRRTGTSNSTTRHVDFAAGTNAGTNPAPTTDLEAQRTTQTPPRRPLNRLLPSVFDTRVPDGGSPSPSPAQDGRIPRVRYGVRRTNSLPAHLLSGGNAAPLRRTSSPFVPHPLSLAPTPVDARIAANGEAEEEEENISRTTAIVLLLVSTGLVAVCAEFMVGSINDITSNPGSGVSATFIGLIVLPIVGNAAEHVTAVTVAMKNKMDLAIGVAVGSSIQIGRYTPCLNFHVLGWVGSSVEVDLRLANAREQPSSSHPSLCYWGGACPKT
jgi:Ca2+:H+ antiporter